MYLIEMLSKRYRNRSQRTNILDQLYKDELEPEDRSERLTNAPKKKKNQALLPTARSVQRSSLKLPMMPSSEPLRT